MTNTWSGLADAAVQLGLLTGAGTDDIRALAHASTLPEPWDCFRDDHLDTTSFAVLHLVMRNAVAERLSLTPDALQAEVRAGHSAAQLARAHSTTEHAMSNAAIMGHGSASSRRCMPGHGRKRARTRSTRASTTSGRSCSIDWSMTLGRRRCPDRTDT